MIQFLKKIFQRVGGETVLRPPGAVPEDEFMQRCIQCNRCVQVCPYDSIKAADAGFGGKFGSPVVYPRDIPCYVCMKCPPICPTGALDNDVTDKRQIAMGIAWIDKDTCLPYNGVICRACFDVCPIYREALTLDDDIYPVVHKDPCIGCGICQHVCPVDEGAIFVDTEHNV